MKYTFLLPAYKAPFLREALASILAQTYTDFQVIVSDDCSPEDLKSIVDEFADDERLVYRRNETNIGGRDLVKHWNMLVDLCRTEWLILASDDDVYHSHFLEEIDRLQRKYPEVDLIRARCQTIDKNGEVTRVEMPMDERVSQAEFMAYFAAPRSIQCIANYVFRASSLSRRGGFVNYPYAWGSDDMAVAYAAAKGMAATKEVLFSFRQSGLNISSHKVSFEETRDRLVARMRLECDRMALVEEIGDTGDSLTRLYLKIFVGWHKKFFRHVLMVDGYILPLKTLPGIVRKYRSYFPTRYYIYLFYRAWIEKRIFKKRIRGKAI